MGPESFPKKIELRDGSSVTILPLKPRDMPALVTFYGGLTAEERLVLKDDVTTPEWAERISQGLESGEVICLIAVKGQELVGEVTLHRTIGGWTRHVGEVRVACHPSWRRRGLGTRLVGALDQIATDLGIEKIIVQVVENQLGARRTFEKLGFKKEAVLAHHILDLGGTKRDLILMANDVPHIWAAMEALSSEVPIRLGE